METATHIETHCKLNLLNHLDFLVHSHQQTKPAATCNINTPAALCCPAMRGIVWLIWALATVAAAAGTLDLIGLAAVILAEMRVMPAPTTS